MKIKRKSLNGSTKRTPKFRILQYEEDQLSKRQRRVLKDLREGKQSHFYHPTEDEYADALIRARGQVPEAAKLLDVLPSSVHRAVIRWPSVAEAKDTGRAMAIYYAEQRVLEHVESGDGRVSLDAAKFVLTQLGRKHGYVHGHDGRGGASGGDALQIFVNLFGISRDELLKTAALPARGETVSEPQETGAEDVVDAEFREDLDPG